VIEEVLGGLKRLEAVFDSPAGTKESDEADILGRRSSCFCIAGASFVIDYLGISGNENPLW
jgi:hypothetical protein